MNIEKKVIEEYKLSEGRGSMYAEVIRTATVVFVNGKFAKCDYEFGEHIHYTYDDWVFLLKVAQKIKELQEEKGGN